MGLPSASASPSTLKVDKRTIRYGPINYKTRGELVRKFLGAMSDPMEDFDKQVANTSVEQLEKIARNNGVSSVDEYIAQSHESIKLIRRAMEGPTFFESNGGEELFLSNIGAKEEDNEDYRLAFLSTVLSPFNENLSDDDLTEILENMTKGQMKEIWNMSLEMGPYRPKSD